MSRDGDQIRQLQQQAVFAGLSDATLRFLLGRAIEVVVEPGGYFFREGEAGRELFVLTAGRAEAIKRRDGASLSLAFLEVGDCFGEIALLSVSARSASVKALVRSQALRITNGDLYALYRLELEQFTMIMMNLGREVCRRLRAADEALFQLAGRPVGTDIGIPAMPDDT